MQPDSFNFCHFVELLTVCFALEDDLPNHVANLVALLTVDLEADPAPAHCKSTLLSLLFNSPKFNSSRQKDVCLNLPQESSREGT